MKKIIRCFPILIIVIPLAASCKSTGTDNHQDENGDESNVVTVSIDKNITYQVIDGFGLFGARSVWWDGNRNNLFSEEWARMIIEDLGVTIWRNEYYPPQTPISPQDADWEKQRPVVEGLARAAGEAGEDLKMIFSVWSPPDEMKIAISESGNHLPGPGGKTREVDVPHPGGTKWGGTLNPEMFEDFGNWLADGVALYEELGIDLYAISPQNEPLFEQFYNSCFYRTDWFAEMLEHSIPVVKNRYPDVKIFASENMLGMEGGTDRQWFYHTELMKHENALDQIDIWAIHGYLDGVHPTVSSTAARNWRNHYTEFSKPTGKPVWMTETSGYHDHWLTVNGQAGALDLGLAIHAALHHGNVSAWLWWQGSDAGTLNEYNLMQTETNPGKRYYVSRQYYRYIRPGAERIKAEYNNSDGVFATAYYHEEMETFTIVAINTNTEPVKLQIEGSNLPESYKMIVTNSQLNASDEREVLLSEIEIPAISIVTLVHGDAFK